MARETLQVKQIAPKVEGDIDGPDVTPSLSGTVCVDNSLQQVGHEDFLTVQKVGVDAPYAKIRWTELVRSVVLRRRW